MIKAGIYGGSGYTGQELLRILMGHPETEIVAVTSRKYKGASIAEIFPVFTNLTDIEYIDASPDMVADLCDVVFLALPHGEAMSVAPAFLEAERKVIDLSADFRIHDVEVYEKWYIKHTAPELLDKAVFGLPEMHRKEIKQAEFVANPGCYPTGIILGLAPLLREQCIDTGTIIVDSKSGASGAGREVQLGTLFCEVNEGFKAYKVASHRHTPEIEQELSLLAGHEVKISFTPHLIPVNRGMLNTIYAQLKKDITVEEIHSIYTIYYENEPFVRTYKEGTFPNITSVSGSNYCDIGVTIDKRTGRVIIISAIDNLIKGASGQAVQNMNLLFGLPEDTGLKTISIFP